MSWWDAALWGLAGGGAVGVLSLMTAIREAGARWPWRKGEMWPELTHMAGGLVLGALVSAAASSQISGPWPAFIFGVGAPATIRGLLSGVQVTARRLEVLDSPVDDPNTEGESP
ncbi:MULTISPECIES: hypothetical protein [Kitasatospora]|uniref:Uncharacterized protein n=1 Tax=Kitasatospora setae (strain ATCC 33774 / DSM 43861 / JCM 3304 / KCC A-0304 / NBRC 14216 / KM-6054) TaxID=452652 RepID=E4MYY4_KITSK|nr:MULTISPECIES: hypothetical protein [Kitasatospora]BAJ25877.1 hypothetical protein KSE_00240t [Kitasatospora setae KM-6054]BAJ33401.1 hypothetical protein KSE_76500t [Kitasatospora setae KM-6054]